MTPSAKKKEKKKKSFMILDPLKLGINIFFSPACNIFSIPFDQEISQKLS